MVPYAPKLGIELHKTIRQSILRTLFEHRLRLGDASQASRRAV